MKLLFRTFLAVIVLTSSIAGAQTLPTSWRTIESLKTGRFLFQAMYIGNDRILVMGGLKNVSYSNPTASCEIINVKTGKISRAMSMPLPRTDFPAVLTKNGMIVVVGGLTSATDYIGPITSQVDLYDPTNDSWRTIGNLLVPRRQHCAIFLDDERLLVVGGRREDLTVLSDAEIFNIRTGQSERVNDYSFDVSYPVSAYSQNGDILVFLGRNGGAGSWRDTSVFRFNTTTKSFERGSTLPEQVHIASVTKLADGRTLMVGGSFFEGNPFLLSNAISLETENAVYTKQATMPIGLVWHQTCQYDNKRVMIIGGFDSTKQGSSRCFWYEWANNSVSEAPKLFDARTYFQAVTVPVVDSKNQLRNKIVVIGGVSDPSIGEVFNSIEVFDEEPEVVSVSQEPISHGEAQTTSGALFIGYSSHRENTVQIHYRVDFRTDVDIRLYNIQGAELTNIVSEVQDAGSYRLPFSTKNLPSGMYVLVMKAAGQVYTTPCSIIR